MLWLGLDWWVLFSMSTIATLRSGVSCPSPSVSDSYRSMFSDWQSGSSLQHHRFKLTLKWTVVNWTGPNWTLNMENGRTEENMEHLSEAKEEHVEEANLEIAQSKGTDCSVGCE
ncbi:hypothetical protein INR49_007657 [Caranx melampygus]|nr:hypothetical protein INR49_007657 [Caranx melampygus]